jgi:hypothetical protein
MVHFTAAVFHEGRRLLVAIEGVGQVEARSLFEAEDLARRLIEWHVGAAYPDRTIPSNPESLGALNFRIEIVRSDSPRERRRLWARYAEILRIDGRRSAAAHRGREVSEVSNSGRRTRRTVTRPSPQQGQTS